MTVDSEQPQDSLEAGQQTTMIEELDIINLAPRKPDWDLKRDIAKKLEKLERRTARAIGEIIRDRLKANTEEEDLASAVKAGASYAAVPLYRVFCQTTNYGGTISKGHDSEKVETMKKSEERLLTIKFNADTAAQMR